jgi:hypothetical protein
VQEAKQAARVIAWPAPQDYNEAIQNPHANLGDEELRACTVHVDKLGLPRPMTGAFASVYRISAKTRDIALRCFLRNIVDQEERYAQISRYVMSDDLQYTVGFEFLPKGVRVGSDWFPVLKMDYVDGLPLDEYVRGNLRNAGKLAALADSFLKMFNDLQQAGIAHSDLQHGNILVCGDELRLVDYDGMFVPGMEGMHSNELGHPNYQLPHRSAHDFGKHLDHFSAWVIYASLRSLALDPSLFQKLAAGDDCLLFRRDDYLNPEYSHTFSVLENHNDAEIAALARCVRWQLQKKPEEVDRLSTRLPEIGKLPKLKPARQKPRVTPESEAGTASAPKSTLPDWISDPGAAAALRGRTQSAPAPQSPTPPYVVPGIPPELVTPRPRKVAYNPNGHGGNPIHHQWLMLINPLVWWLVFTLFLYIPQDRELIKRGVDVTGTVQSVRMYRDKSNYRYNVRYSYDYGNSRYTSEVNAVAGDYPNAREPLQGQTFAVRLLPESPKTHVQTLTLHESGTVSAAHHKLGGDTALAYFLTAVNLLMELMIWWIPFCHWMLVSKGLAARGKITRKEIVVGNKNSKTYWIEYSFHTKFGKMHGRMRVPPGRYDKIKEQDRVTVVYNPNNPQSSTVYEWATYKAVP